MSDNDRFVGFVIKVKRDFDNAFCKEMEKYGLTVAQALMLREVGLHPYGLSLSDLAKGLGVNRSLVTRSMKTLANTKYVNLTATDGRTQCIRLTDEGIRFLADMENEIDNFADEYLSPLNPEERKNLTEYVQKLSVVDF